MPRPGRRNARRRQGSPSGICRSCRSAPELAGEETCEPCGELAIARAGVEAWLHMYAEWVLDLSRHEERRTGPP